jgi:hypothetical protein
MTLLDPKLARALFLEIGGRLREELAVTEPPPQRLMELLAQLDGRAQTEAELERAPRPQGPRMNLEP